MVVCNILLCNAIILRTTCKTYGLFTIVQKDKALDNCILVTFNRTKDNCQTACLQDPSCRSINVEDNGFGCQLLGNAIGDAGASLVTKSGWNYLSTDNQTKNVRERKHRMPFSDIIFSPEVPWTLISKTWQMGERVRLNKEGCLTMCEPF